MKDLTLNGHLKRGSKGKKVRLIQEWLILRGVDIQIDGWFGPATQQAVKKYQGKHDLKIDGKVGKLTFISLTMPMRRAIHAIQPRTRQLSSLVVTYAQRHFKQDPREVGGQNRGPWVRLYMRGHDGQEWPWCAGFASYVLKQAAGTLGVRVPITTSFSCDSLAASAKQRGVFLSESKVRSGSPVKSGSLFLVRRTATDWTHTGIVVRADAETIETIEGNTNDDGHRDGYEVCHRIRGYKNKDFISI